MKLKEMICNLKEVTLDNKQDAEVVLETIKFLQKVEKALTCDSDCDECVILDRYF